jgi:alanyl aminopeptidase
MAQVARDPATRREAARRGRAWLGPANGHIDDTAVPPELAGTALTVALQDGDAALFDVAMARLRGTDDALVRNRLLGAIGSVRDEALATRALGLSLDPALHVNEVLTPLSAQMDQLERREAAWDWLEHNVDPITGRVATTRAADLPWFGARFCDEAHAQRIQTFFGPRIENLAGGPRNLAGATEVIRLCTARVATQGDSVRAFFSPPSRH